MAHAWLWPKMYHVYVLQSLKNSRRYIGVTVRDPQVRFREHQSGASSWTRPNGPFELVYTEAYSEKTLAYQRERFFKSGYGREVLRNILLAKHQFRSS